MGAQAIFARQTAEAAGNSANVLSVLAKQTEVAATATRQATVNTLQDQGTRTAQQLALLQPTQTREVEQTGEAHTQETADARTQATYQAQHATDVAATPTARAIATGTAEAQAQASQTAILLVAQAKQTATIEALNTKEEIAQREEHRLIQGATLNARRDASYVSEAIGVLWVPVTGAFFLLIVLVGVWQLFRAITYRIQAASMALMPEPKVITDADGYTIGYLTPVPGRFVFTPIHQTFLDQPPDVSRPEPPLITSGITSKPAVSEPDPNLLNGQIHRVALESFASEILKTGDWTQATWADKVIPLGAPVTAKVAYVLTKDTKDSNGQTVYGGYARVMQYFTDKHLILGRGAGATGKWNPNAPREVGQVLAILFNEAPLPSLPAPVEKPVATSRARVRKTLTPSPTLPGAAAE